LTMSSLLGYGFQSILILILAFNSNIELLPELILGANGGLMVLVIIRSHF
jgi:hypothetical protein